MIYFWYTVAYLCKYSNFTLGIIIRPVSLREMCVSMSAQQMHFNNVGGLKNSCTENSWNSFWVIHCIPATGEV